ncbi:light-harvesting protein [Bacillus thuringiensis]|nr:light-harvesting protein [Bacillus thuringiensis]NUW47407.1 light-harvesting protein [Bacillus thuringiensis]QWS48658.1 light-harvesting protein [Bacillus thuringiensis]HDR6821287.1 light-harvesting protein [Bacillus thuringiensis]
MEVTFITQLYIMVLLALIIHMIIW